jgi:putative tryptophan/tyrosine transport system substrate-binding protein
MKRRDFITLLGGATAWPLAARAQQPRPMRRIGLLIAFGENDPEPQSWVAAFREELRKLGWTEGRNIQIDTCWAKADVESMKRCSKELVALQPDFILTSSTPVTAAMLQHTRTIPIIFVLVADPVGSGFVTSLSRPGGNATGFTPIEGSLGGKWVELLKDIAPRVTKVTLMFNPPTATFVEGYLNPFKAAAASLGVEAIVAPVHDMPEVESLVSTSGQNSGLVVIPDVFTVGHRSEIILLADRYHIPAIYWSRSPGPRPKESAIASAAGPATVLNVAVTGRTSAIDGSFDNGSRVTLTITRERGLSLSCVRSIAATRPWTNGSCVTAKTGRLGNALFVSVMNCSMVSDQAKPRRVIAGGPRSSKQMSGGRPLSWERTLAERACLSLARGEIPKNANGALAGTDRAGRWSIS